MAKTPLSSWCVLRSNETLKTLIRRRMDEQNLSMQALSDKSGIPYDHIRQYLKGTYGKHGVSQWSIVKLSEVLGIEVGIRIELKW
jgi:predicted transcriptional regulator